MKKSIINFCLLSSTIFFLFSQFSCKKSDSIYHQEFAHDINSSEVSQKKGVKGKSCNVDFNDMHITTMWADDCSTAQIIFALCCECTSSSSFETGCTIPGGTLTIQTEECPMDFYSYEANVRYISIPENTCYPIVFNIENKGCDIVYISQIWFNGADLEIDDNYSPDYCG